MPAQVKQASPPRKKTVPPDVVDHLDAQQRRGAESGIGFDGAFIKQPAVRLTKRQEARFSSQTMTYRDHRQRNKAAPRALGNNEGFQRGEATTS
jgi:hypothetical protein